MPVIDNDNQEIDVTAMGSGTPGNHWNSFTKAKLISHSTPDAAMVEEGLESAQNAIQ